MNMVSHHADVKFSFRPENVHLFDPVTEKNLF